MRDGEIKQRESCLFCTWLTQVPQVHKSTTRKIPEYKARISPKHHWVCISPKKKKNSQQKEGILEGFPMLDEKSAKKRKQEVREINRLGTTLHAGDPGLILGYPHVPPEHCWE